MFGCCSGPGRPLEFVRKLLEGPTREGLLAGGSDLPVESREAPGWVERCNGRKY